MTVYFLAPEDNKPWGGIRRIYMFVDILNQANIPAAVLRGSPDFRCTWFDHQTVMQSAEGLRLDAQRDLLVIPEAYGPRIVSLAPRIRRVMLAQNPYELCMRLSERASIPFWRALETINGVLVVSDESAALMARITPGLAVHKLQLGIDQTLYYPDVKSSKTIAFMPRKRRAEARAVMGMLYARGLLDDWEVIEIDAVSEQEAAAALRRSAIFLSFSHLEGFGLPAAEAMACGCIVVGFDGRGGREFFRPDFGFPVDDGDVDGMVVVVEQILRQYHDDPTPLVSVATAAAGYIAATYSLERQRQSVVATFTDLLNHRAVGADVVTLTNRDVRYERPAHWASRAVRFLSHVQRAVAREHR